jgi:hypothetical protein
VSDAECNGNRDQFWGVTDYDIARGCEKIQRADRNRDCGGFDQTFSVVREFCGHRPPLQLDHLRA